MRGGVFNSVRAMCLAFSFMLAASTSSAQLESGRASGSSTQGLVPGDALVFGVAIGQDWEYFRSKVKRAGFTFEFTEHPRYWMDFRYRLPWGPDSGSSQLVPISVRWELVDGRKFIAENVDVASFAGQAYDRVALTTQYFRWLRDKGFAPLFPRLSLEVWEDLMILKWELRINLAWRADGRHAESLEENIESQFADVAYVIAKVKGQPAPQLDFSRRFEAGPLNKSGQRQ